MIMFICQICFEKPKILGENPSSGNAAFRNLARRNVFPVPQIRRQVFAYDEKLFIGFRITDLKVSTVTLTTVAYQRLPCVHLSQWYYVIYLLELDRHTLEIS